MIKLKQLLFEGIKEDFEVDRCDKKDIEHFVIKHYLKKFPVNIRRVYGLYTKSPIRKIVGMIIYGVPFFTAAKFLEPEITLQETLELKRLYIDDIGIKNLESFFIGKSLKLLKQDEPNIKIVITFADDTQNHVGSIYQATNAIYIGKTQGGTRGGSHGRPFERSAGKHKYVYILRGDEKSIKDKLRQQPYPKLTI